MKQFTYKQLGEKIKEMYIHQDEYRLVRHLQEFKDGEKYLGDYLTYLIFEQLQGKSPRFYSIVGPYDTISNKAPQQALVFEDGNLLLNVDYTRYADMRTGVMDPVLLESLGHTSLEGTKILYLGTGKVATESLKALKEYFPEVKSVDYINKSGDPKSFGEVAIQLGIILSKVSLDEVSQYDFIFCHTAASDPVLTKEYLQKIKQGAVITTFVGPETEVADEFFDTTNATIFTDWAESLTSGKDLRQALEKGYLDKDKIVFLKDLFDGNRPTASQQKYVLYRSTGTPIQNLAVLKLLL